MAAIPTPQEAEALLKKYNEDAFHLRHGAIVSGVMGWFAGKHDPGREDYWRTVGMLHDIDFGRWPEAHCVKGIALLREEGVDEGVIRSAMSHGWGMTESPFEPESQMEKILYAVDELTGLIGAAAIMRPSKSVVDLEVGSVKKKFKDKKFAAGCSRDTIRQGAENLGWELDYLFGQTIEAMRNLMDVMEI
jgi:predicted hydrolase (HD superfamily)